MLVHLQRDTWQIVDWGAISVIVVAAIDFWRRPATESTESDKQWLEGRNAFQRGQELYFQNELQQALPCFDTAIDSGDLRMQTYSMRGGCLQSLQFDLDAIDDFTKAIGFAPDDSNFYFMRSSSKGAVGDLQGRVADLNEAIRVAGIYNAANRSHDAFAKEHGSKTELPKSIK